jgi:hypothetical protein
MTGVLASARHVTRTVVSSPDPGMSATATSDRGGGSIRRSLILDMVGQGWRSQRTDVTVDGSGRLASAA